MKSIEIQFYSNSQFCSDILDRVRFIRFADDGHTIEDIAEFNIDRFKVAVEYIKEIYVDIYGAKIVKFKEREVALDAKTLKQLFKEAQKEIDDFEQYMNEKYGE
ncbi:hypothetical protein [Vibrio harveyi]|uniref:hypothetical protein n=1 Tax=Vibrio harveyi TaxID=669 RepID=UPI003CF95952